MFSRIITTNVKRNTTDISQGILDHVSTLASTVASTGGIESEIPKMFSRIITTNVKRNTTDVSQGILDHETRQDFSIIWILLAVVLIATFFGVTFLCRSYFLSRGKRGGEVPEIYLSHSGSAVNGTVSHEPDMHRHTEPTTNHATTALSSENEYHTVGDTGDFNVDRNERTQQTSSNDNGTYESIPINRLMQNNYRVPDGEQLIDQSTHPDGNKSRRERKIDIGTPVVPSRSLGGAEITLKDVKKKLKMSKLRTNSEKVNTNVDNSIGQIGSDLNTKLPAKMPTRATVKHQTVKGHRDKDTVDHYAKSFNDGVTSRQDDEYSEVMDTVKRTSTTVCNELDNDRTASSQVKVKFVVDNKQRQSTKIPVYGETNQVRKGKNNGHNEGVEDVYAEGSETIKRTTPVYNEGNMNGNAGAIPVIDTLPPPNERGTSITTNEPLYNTVTKSGETTGIAKGEDRNDKSSLTSSVNGKSMQNSMGAENAKDDSRLLSAKNEYGDVDTAEKRVTQIYAEIDVDEHASAVHVNGDVASGTGVESMPDINVPLLRQGDKNTNSMKMAKDDSNFLVADDEYGEVSDTLKRVTPVYAEVGEDGIAAPVHAKAHVPSKPVKDTMPAKSIPVYGKVDKNTDGMKMSKGESNFLVADDEYGEVSDTLKRITPVYAEVGEDGNTAPVHVKGNGPSKAVKDTMPAKSIPVYGKVDKNTNDMKMAKGESNLLVADDEYGEVSDTLKRITPVYAEVGEDGNTAPVHVKGHGPSKPVKDTMPAKSIPVYGKVEKNTNDMKMAKGESNLLVADDEYGEVSDTLKRITPVYAEVGEDGNTAPVHVKGHGPSEAVKDTMPAKSIPVYGKVDKNTNDIKLTKGESNLLIADDEYGEVSDTLKRITPVYAEVGEDGNTSPVHANCHRPSKAVKDTMPAKSIPVYGKVDKNTDGMKMAKGESNLLVADDEYGEVSDTLKRITPVYAEVGEDGIAAPVHAKGHLPSKPVKDTMPAKSIPVYGKVDKNTDGKKMAKGESNLLVADDEYGEVSDTLKRITPVYAEVGEDGIVAVHVKGHLPSEVFKATMPE
ncbi:uncharacterized protein [Apostichopus japonicus]|uniref:uncharacterized protein isoform X2 n=1 Tax=Stichopus japonicus TaxID=307972 RepID=UPI003AB5149B